jgi:hypothetical protein
MAVRPPGVLVIDAALVALAGYVEWRPPANPTILTARSGRGVLGHRLVRSSQRRGRVTVGPCATTATVATPIVTRAATIGAMSAAIGMVVGSLPVTSVGPKMLTPAAATQIVMVAPASNTAARRVVSPRSRAIAIPAAIDAPNPQNQAPNAATGIRCCSLPWTMSGDNTLITATQTQIATTVAIAHASQDLSTAGDRAGAGHPPCTAPVRGGVRVVSVVVATVQPYEAVRRTSSDHRPIRTSTRGRRPRRPEVPVMTT